MLYNTYAMGGNRPTPRDETPRGNCPPCILPANKLPAEQTPRRKAPRGKNSPRAIVPATSVPPSKLPANHSPRKQSPRDHCPRHLKTTLYSTLFYSIDIENLIYISWIYIRNRHGMNVAKYIQNVNFNDILCFQNIIENFHVNFQKLRASNKLQHVRL